MPKTLSQQQPMLEVTQHAAEVRKTLIPSVCIAQSSCRGAIIVLGKVGIPVIHVERAGSYPVDDQSICVTHHVALHLAAEGFIVPYQRTF
jgi:hypothetical protein